MSTTPGAIYCRISQDGEGLALGVERQQEDCLALAEQRGVSVAPEHVLIENDVGASTRSRKARPVYEELKALVSSGKVKAVVFYSNSRLTRRPRELEDWITLYETTGVKLYSKVSGDDDLGTADGRMVARIKGSVDAAEAERISERVKRSLEQSRQSGLMSTGGPRAFGFTDRSLSPSLVPEEAEAIRQGAALLIAGGSYAEVGRTWMTQGHKPVRVKTWTRESVRAIYQSGRIAGLVTYEGKVIATSNVPPIIDRATWQAVRDAVAARGGPSRPESGARVHVLSGFLFCATCGTKLSMGNGSYRCLKTRQGCGGVRRNKVWLDTLVNGYVVGKLEQGDGVEEVLDTPSHEGEVVRLEERITEARQRHTDGLLEGEDFYPLLTDLRAKVTELRKAEALTVRTATQSAALHDPMRVWESGTLVKRRALLAGLVQGIYVKPVGKLGRAPVPVESVEIVPMQRVVLRGAV